MLIDKTNVIQYLDTARIPKDQNLIDKILDLQRLLKLRLPFETALNKSPGLCPCILIELACRVMVTSFSRENLFTSLGLQVSGMSNNNANGQEGPRGQIQDLKFLGFFAHFCKICCQKQHISRVENLVP